MSGFEQSQLNEIERLVARQLDMAPLVTEFSVTEWPPGCVLRAGNKETLEAAYATAGRQLLERGARIPGLLDGSDFRHESQHIDAAHQIDIDVLEMGLAVVRYREGFFLRREGYAVWPFVSLAEGTPIENAAILGHPIDPSKYDLNKMQQLGFISVNQLGDAIHEHNRTLDSSRPPLPLPLAYKS